METRLRGVRSSNGCGSPSAQGSSHRSQRALAMSSGAFLYPVFRDTVAPFAQRSCFVASAASSEHTAPGIGVSPEFFKFCFRPFWGVLGCGWLRNWVLKPHLEFGARGSFAFSGLAALIVLSCTTSSPSRPALEAPPGLAAFTACDSARVFSGPSARVAFVLCHSFFILLAGGIPWSSSLGRLAGLAVPPPVVIVSSCRHHMRC